MNNARISLALVTMFLATPAFSQHGESLQVRETKAETSSERIPPQKVIVVTGARFSYKLVEKWIDEYSAVNPNVQIVVEARGSSDPLKYDILAEVYEHDEDLRKTRQYVNVGRYAILPVATAGSSFAHTYGDKGLNNAAIKQIFFHNIFAGEGKQQAINEPFTVYTRLQKAGVPAVFARYFGQDQKDIKGTAIAGADAHLLKALLRDSVGVTYLPLPLIYDETSRKPIDGLTVLPVDLNGNKKVNAEEKFYDNLDTVIGRLEELSSRDIQNIPVENLHLSVDTKTASPEAVEFLKWVYENGQDDLHHFGYLKPEVGKTADRRTEDSTFKGGK